MFKAYPIEMKAKQNFNEINRLEIKQGDTLTIIDGQLVVVFFV
jgi:hypothetical protein